LFGSIKGVRFSRGSPPTVRHAMPHRLWVGVDTWNLLVADNGELARWLSFAELTRIGLLNRSFKRMFEQALGFLWRSRSAACARAELSHTVGCAVRFGQTEHVRILMPLLVRAAEAGGGAGGDKSVVPYLFDAIREGHAEVVGALLEIGGPELPMTDSGESCLTVVVRHERVEILGVLARAMIDMDFYKLLLMPCLSNIDYSDMSCLHYSVYRGDPVMVRALLEAAGPARRELLMLRNAAGDSCLHVCVKEGRVDVVRALLEAAGDWRRELLMLKDARGNSCLHVCVRGAGMNPVMALRDFDPGGGLQLMPMPQNTCLYASVNEMRVNVLRALLEAAGDWRRELLMLECHYGQSCLYLSVMMGNLTLTNAMLEGAGDDAPELVMVPGTMGGNCLHVAAMFACEHLMMALLEAAGPRRRELLAGEHKSELLLIPDRVIDLSSVNAAKCFGWRR
jgi:hypothetical protein